MRYDPFLRLRYAKAGGHVHCRLFSARDPRQTYAKCGDLTFSEDEWPDAASRLRHAGIEVLEEDAGS